MVFACLLQPGWLQAQAFNSEYDEYFKRYSDRYLLIYLPDGDWRWFKAQCIQESGFRLDPLAASGAGAVGTCQIIPDAATDVGLHPDERTDPEKNIKAAAKLLRRNIREWWPRETRYQRLQLGQASYNAGAGNIIEAQFKCGSPVVWKDIAPCLHLVTGLNNSYETIHYVAVIPKWYRGIVYQDSQESSK